MIDPEIVAGLRRVVDRAAGAPQFGVPRADVVLVRAEYLRALLEEVQVLDAEIREFIADQDVKVDEVHQWYYEQIRRRLKKQGRI